MMADWYQFSVKQLEEKLGTDVKSGLAGGEAAQRLARDGRNVFQRGTRAGLLSLAWRQIKSPLVYVMIAAAAVTLFFRHFTDTIVILLVVTINIGIGMFQEGRADRAFRKLQESQQLFAFVIRDGGKRVIPSEEVVAGDVVELSLGDAVPADCRVVDCIDLSANESSLTGEWVAVSKNSKVIANTAHITAQSNMLFMGTLITSGSSRALVVETGNSTQIGKIASSLTSVDQTETNLQRSVKGLAKFMSLIILVSTILIFALGLVRGHTFEEMILISVAVAIAAIPSGLPIAVTVVLAVGLERLLSRGGLVRNLLAAETLGSTTLIMTDKTGTLTRAQMQVAKIIPAPNVEESNVLTGAIIASDAFIEKKDGDLSDWVIHGLPIEKAIVEAGVEHGYDIEKMRSASPRLDYVPFQSEARYAASLNQIDGARKIFLNGAPELILSSAAELNPEQKSELLKQHNLAAEGGMRLIGVGKREYEADSINRKENILEGNKFLGFIAFHDPVREDAEEAVSIARAAGARVVMVTGDQAVTAARVASQVGIAAPGEPVVTGEELDDLTGKELSARVDDCRIFARVLPNQKLNLLRLFKSQGEVVAMTGDGVNDAPALVNADIGIALGSGTEVAKEASDMVLVNNSFSIIVAAIEEGRRIIDNLKKIVAYLLSTSFGEIIVVGVSLVAGLPIPILPVQIFWTNVIEEGFMTFAFAFEPAEGDVMRRRPQDETVKNVLSGDVRKLVIVMSFVTGVIVTALYFTLHARGIEIEKLRTITFALISIDSIFFTFSLKNLKKRLWQINIFSNKYLLFAFSTSVGGLLLALFFPPLQALLHITPLTVGELLLILGVGIVNLITIELSKFFLWRF